MEDCLNAINYYIEGIGQSALVTELPIALAVAIGYLSFYLSGQGLRMEAPFIGGLGGIPLFVAINAIARDLSDDNTIGGIGQAIEAIKYKFRYKKLKKEEEELKD